MARGSGGRGGWAALWPLLKRYGPQAMVAAKALKGYLDAHPELPAQVRQQALSARDSLIDLRHRGSTPERIVGALDVVDELARDRQTRGRAGDAAEAGQWLARTQSIRQAVDVAGLHTGKQRKLMLEHAAGRTDELTAEAFTALIDGSLS